MVKKGVSAMINKGKIILLNGVSSSGKSSLAKLLATKLEGYFHFGIDDFDLVIEKMENRNTSKLIPIPTEVFFHETVKLFSDKGIHLIVDQILHDEETISHLVSVLKEYPVLFIGIHCSVEEIDRREKNRGNRIIGQGRAQLEFVHRQNETYDIEVNTMETSLEVAAERIVARIMDGEAIGGWTNFSESWSKKLAEE
ncbi:chloramphenicol 3-O phosphotransferase [Planococcus citreus]|uniref:Chloramphenicol 3-O phosphotransferase n=2 Tax=Planococcus citreus TaxID=1373 RepID=A0A497YFP1_9BACL|nr:chloramphenicol 3-O phosphotransferase [Planococcus citreus]